MYKKYSIGRFDLPLINYSFSVRGDVIGLDLTRSAHLHLHLYGRRIPILEPR